MADSKKDNLITDIDFNAQIIYHPDVDQDYLSRNVIDRLREGMHDFDNIRGSKAYIGKIAKTMMDVQMSPEMLDELRQSPEDSLEIYNRYSIKQVEGFEKALAQYEKQLGYKDVPEDQIQKIVSAQREVFEKHLNGTILQQQYDYQVLLQLKDLNDAKFKIDSLITPPITDPEGLNDAFAQYGKTLRIARDRFPDNKQFANHVDNEIEKQDMPKSFKGSSAFDDFTKQSKEKRWNMKAYGSHTMNTLKMGGLLTVVVGGLAATLGVITFPTALIALGVSTMLSAPFAILKEKMGLSESKISKGKFKHLDLTDSNKFVRGVAHVAMFGLQVLTIGGITSALSNAFGVGAELAGNEIAKAVADADVDQAQEVFTKAQELKEAAETAFLEANDEFLELGISQATQSAPAGATNVAEATNVVHKLFGVPDSWRLDTEGFQIVKEWFGFGAQQASEVAQVAEPVAQAVDPSYAQNIVDASKDVVNATNDLMAFQEVASNAATALQGSQLGANEIATVAAIGATSQVIAERHGRSDNSSENYYRGNIVDSFDDEVINKDKVEQSIQKQKIS